MAQKVCNFDGWGMQVTTPTDGTVGAARVTDFTRAVFTSRLLLQGLMHAPSIHIHWDDYIEFRAVTRQHKGTTELQRVKFM